MQPQMIDESLDRRRKNRRNCSYLPVDFVSEKRLHRGLILDISETGARIEITSPLKPGQYATMTFLENFEKGPVKTTGRVVRSFDKGFAVHFDNLTRNQSQAIGSFVDLS